MITTDNGRRVSVLAAEERATPGVPLRHQKPHLLLCIPPKEDGKSYI